MSKTLTQPNTKTNTNSPTNILHKTAATQDKVIPRKEGIPNKEAITHQVHRWAINRVAMGEVMGRVMGNREGIMIRVGDEAMVGLWTRVLRR